MKESEKADPYPFARFNRKVEVVNYTDKEYKDCIRSISTDWTKKETDHLFRLCERYSLRFIIIADRFEQHSDDEENKPQEIERKRDAKQKEKEKAKN